MRVRPQRHCRSTIFRRAACGLFIFLKVRKRLRINAEIEAGTYSPRKNERSSARSAKNEVEMRLREYDPDWYEYK